MEIAKVTPPKLKRIWKPVAIVALVGLLIVGEVAFQRAKNKGWTTYEHRAVGSIVLAPDGTVWLADPRVHRFDGEAWTAFTEYDGLASDSVGRIAVAPDGTLWFGTFYDGVSRFDGETWTTFTTDDGLGESGVISIAVAPDGVVWFGTREDGVSRFDGKTWTTFTSADGLVHDFISSIAVAADGIVWFGTDGGVSRFDGETWTTYTTADGLGGNDINSIAVAPDGIVWFGTYGGVSRFDGETWTTYTTADGLGGNDVLSVAVAPDGVLWFGTYDGGISRFDGATWTSYTPVNSGLADFARGSPRGLAIDSQGRVWVGTWSGLSVFDERVSLPAQTLQVWAQVWGVLRGIGIATSVLLTILGGIVWFDRQRSNGLLLSKLTRDIPVGIAVIVNVVLYIMNERGMHAAVTIWIYGLRGMIALMVLLLLLWWMYRKDVDVGVVVLRLLQSMMLGIGITLGVIALIGGFEAVVRVLVFAVGILLPGW